MVQGVPFRSVPTPALPGANSHWISGGSRGGEETQTAPLLKYQEKHSLLIRVKGEKIWPNVTWDTQRDTQTQPLCGWGRVVFTTTPCFSSSSSRPAIHRPGTPKDPRNPNKKPDFYDTCDAGVLIGKLPCTSTLAQSVANIPDHRQGRPRVTYHMNCLHLCHAVVNNEAQIKPGTVFTWACREGLWPKAGDEPDIFTAR